MFDPFLTPAALLHLLALIGLILWGARKLHFPRQDLPLAIGIVGWASLVLASYGASLVGELGSLPVFLAAHALALGLLFLVSRALAHEKGFVLVPPPHLSFDEPSGPRLRKGLFWTLALTLGLVAGLALVLGLSVYPDNADSMIYRLPRAFWYVSHGSFLHPFDSLDKRITFYPLCGVSLYVPLVLYNLPGTAHALPSFAAYGLLVFIAYRFARSLSASRLLALFAAWLVALTPNVLAEANSTNDEILAATAFLAFLYLFWRWLGTGLRIYIFLGAAALGLSAGTKLHVVFLMPMIGMALLIGLWNAYRRPALFKLWAEAMGFKSFALALATTLVLFAPFLLFNAASSGRFYFLDDFSHQVFNLGARLQGVGQNLLIYFSQMIFSPIADLNFWPVANDRQHFNIALNTIFTPILQSFISDDPALYHMEYRFVGIVLPVSVRFVEFSLWAGFVWLLWPWQIAMTLRRAFPMRSIFALIAATPLLWLIFWSLSTLYMEGTATYFSFYLIVAAPAAALSFLSIQRSFWRELRWLTLGLVAVSSLLICWNLLMFSGFRALPDLYYAHKWPYDWDLVDEPIISELRKAERIRIIFTHEKMPYFAYMHWNPRAKYETPFPVRSLPEPQKILQILPITSLYSFRFMPLKVPGKATPGVTYLGTIRGIGREAIFAVGNDVAQRHPTESNYLVPHVSETRKPEGLLLRVDHDVAGLSPQDNLTFAYEVWRGKTLVASREASRDPGFVFALPSGAYPAELILTLIVREAWSDKELTRASYPLGGSNGWLSDGPDY